MTMHFSNRKDILDSRDIIERFEELTSEKEALLEQIVEAYDDEELYSDEDRRELQNELNTWIDEHGEEHRILSKLNAQGSDYAPDWEYGETLIRDSYFQTYAQELAEDIGAIDRNAKWPTNCIDWEQAARELQMDYTALDFDGVTYWVRS